MVKNNRKPLKLLAYEIQLLSKRPPGAFRSCVLSVLILKICQIKGDDDDEDDLDEGEGSSDDEEGVEGEGEYLKMEFFNYCYYYYFICITIHNKYITIQYTINFNAKVTIQKVKNIFQVHTLLGCRVQRQGQFLIKFVHFSSFDTYILFCFILN